ncbi:phage/plasmid primase, P4 family [Enterococcus faecium]|uniref:phage/plasmid primase, P4 family n=1 Tax=Enterococcus faecium TaxID=1352 RepID=UPI000252F377|nr:phage/plasmid primase, P4 family [Enterococcus faecium]AFC63716.1 phage DNA polymerase [Enterococcus faecium Aus0004]MDT9534182.1 phage/plasmid primase, P4 family [Enterococcus faecium]MDT9549680.1 phage/plasmid primase, P4 family [Enterococcus faecium]
MQMTIYDAATVGSRSNCVYPNPVTVTDADTMRQAAAFDHVCAAYKQNYRSVDNFLKADCLPMDCDNDHSDDPDDWLTPFDVAMDFPGVGMIFVYSRSHMKQKGKRGPRPRFHVYFICTETTNSEIYSSWKDRLIADYPYFDDGAKDSARFLFGVKNAAVEVYDGEITIDAFLADRFAEWDAAQGQIPEGSRNKTMSHYAGRIIKRLGNTEEAHKQFLKEAEKCSPPLDDAELAGIWASAVKFGAKVAAQEGYIPPEQYNQDFLLMPEDFSDVGQAIVLSREYMDRLRFSPATDYIVFNGSFWEESQPNAQGIAQELTARQLEEAETEIQRCMKEMSENGAWAMLAAMGAKKAMAAFSEAQRRSFEKYERAETYRKYAIKRRDTKYISAALKEARPMIQIEQRVLDADEFLLNLPSGTCDLRTGAVREHNAQDYITKQTAVDPSGDGMDVWEDALQTFFQGDTDLIRYVQEIVGLAAIGKVYIEALVIAYGEGRNGKSTFWNTIARVLGTYSGNMSADTLTVGCKRNVKPELAEAKGKRMIIAAELEEGMRLNTSNVKQLCSTDEIYAEKKYKAPFSYVPTHTLVLYTNHLPRVGAIDQGTWRRLIVIPFNAKIEGKADIKNYSDFLFKMAGGAVLQWIIEGAKRVIAGDYKIVQPRVVQAAIQKYKENNDWLSHFLDDCCEVGDDFEAKSGEFYNAYRSYCLQMGEYTRSTTDFYSALESTGVVRKRTRTGVIIYGLKLKSEFED